MSANQLRNPSTVSYLPQPGDAHAFAGPLLLDELLGLWHV